MMYLIGQLALWLLLTALFAALAGWSFAAYQAIPAEERRSKDRDKLVSDLSALAGGEAPSAPAAAPDTEALRSLTAVREARVAELERSSHEQRARADGLAEELQRLRAQVAESEQQADVAPLPPQSQTGQTHGGETSVHGPQAGEAPDLALQAWRLRYFEQRVRYLEGLHLEAAAAPPLESAPPAPQPPLLEWRVREAQARAQFLADELRRTAPTAPAPGEPAASAFAADRDVDMLLRWRMLYLERRVAHLQNASAQPVQPARPQAMAAPEGAGPDPDRWKWRARYLESRVRHLEHRAADAAPAAASPDAAPLPSPAPRIKEERPPSLPAPQAGAADDFTLIDAISPLQQTTLYSLGIYHFDQIGAWTPANCAWVDRYLRLQGRIEAEEWVEQAGDLAREGPDAARRLIGEDEDASP